MKTITVGRNAQQGQLKQIEIVVRNYLKKYDQVSVVIKKHSESKTQQQLRLYHGKWLPEVADFTGDDRESVHWNLKSRLLHPILMEKREGFQELVELIASTPDRIDETSPLYAMYKREMSLSVATKDEVRLFMRDCKHFFIHELGFLSFTEPSLQGL